VATVNSVSILKFSISLVHFIPKKDSFLLLQLANFHSLKSTNPQTVEHQKSHEIVLEQSPTSIKIYQPNHLNNASYSLPDSLSPATQTFHFPPSFLRHKTPPNGRKIIRLTHG
jgi:hypothetical protein